MSEQKDLIDKIVSLCKRRGFIFQGSEIYGGLAGTWDLGPFGFKLREYIISAWQKIFVNSRSDVFLISSSIISNYKVWKASGHIDSFVDPMIDCKKCKSRFRADEIDVRKGCPKCKGKDFTEARPFNMMFKTFVGPIEDNSSQAFLRPETAQGMFINFKNVLDSLHLDLPFGLAQIGKAFRNEITPRNFIFRSREFEQMELEWFCEEREWEKWFDYWLEVIKKWLSVLSISSSKITFKEVPQKDRAHYSKRTVDIEYDFPFGKSELYGIAWRGNFDISNHAKESGINLGSFPNVIEPTFGIERTILALLTEHYKEEKNRIVLSLPYYFAPVKVAVFPLLANKEELVSKAKSIYKILEKELREKYGYIVWWDQRGNIGKRYYYQDEIGTPWCVTVDYQTLKDETVTLRDRDTMQQERVAINNLADKIIKSLSL
jgi:glycyl-tRNA synthetase